MSLPQVTLVDIHGNPIVPPDPTDPANWPAACDNHFWQVTDPEELAALEAAELERLEELADAPPTSQEDRWAQWLIESSLPPLSGGAPEPYEPTEADWAAYRRHFDQADDFPERTGPIEPSRNRYTPDAFAAVAAIAARPHLD
jgi:hypothetical protein